MTTGSGKIIWILVACDVTRKIGPLYFKVQKTGNTLSFYSICQQSSSTIEVICPSPILGQRRQKFGSNHYLSKICVKRFLNKVKPFCILLNCNGLEKWREIVCYYLVVSRYGRPVIFFRNLVGLLWTCHIKARPISFKDVHESYSLAILNSNAYIFRVGLFFCSLMPNFLNISVYKSSAFLRRPQKIVKSSLWFWHLLSKRQNLEEDFANFCGLLRKTELY